MNYVDVDPAEGAFSDYRCGKRSYEGHKGTDFAVRDLVAMEQGVDVFAAQDGTVLNLRDGVEDRMPTTVEREQMLAENVGCGNGVFIDHGDGWQTIYCHMKKRSITAKTDQKVKAGDKIGQVGHSGAVEFPHLHFGVFFEGNTIDPFTGKDDTRGCGQTGESLWQDSDEVGYSSYNIYATGFRGAVPGIDALKIDASSPDEISTDSNALIFWMSYFGPKEGDEVHLEITDPDGRTLVEKTNVMEKDRAKQFYYAGKPMSPRIISGTYTGTVSVTRKNAEGMPETQKISRDVSVASPSFSAQ